MSCLTDGDLAQTVRRIVATATSDWALIEELRRDVLAVLLEEEKASWAQEYGVGEYECQKIDKLRRELELVDKALRGHKRFTKRGARHA